MYFINYSSETMNMLYILWTPLSIIKLRGGTVFNCAGQEVIWFIIDLHYKYIGFAENTL